MKVILVATFLLFLQPTFAQYNWSELDRELAARQKLLGTNLVVMIWSQKGDSILYKKEMGEFNAKTQAPIASASKWLTAALVLKMVDEGKISLDDKISRYLPEFDKYFKSYITIRQCLSHMTGISDEGGLIKRLLQRRKFDSLEEEVNAFAARDIRANPGNDFWYGNIGLNIAGRVLEVVTKKKFDALIKMKLLAPLEMRRTTFTDLNGNPVNPSGGAQSTAEDYMKFLQMLLNKGKHKTVQVLSEESVEILRQVQNTLSQVRYAPASATGFTYAPGSWVLESERPVTDDDNPKATVLASPGLFGTWPMVDFCRGYAYIVLVKNLLGEERADAHLALKKIIEGQLPTTCK